ncbi:uncharacterized protein LOC111075887 [Drosophila obscura]|uniref:uncharacterized protein LOC111075887 n=1 Tax=Drosophila obscura TaxID=7282 RepID=UPI001BB0F4EE|nr:uncharacterized protein LOC111075887 [Drosophila obscura]
MKKNYLVFVGIGCLISVMPFLVHAMPPLLSVKEPDKSFQNISESIVHSHSWVSNVIQLETKSTTQSAGGTIRGQMVAADSNVSGYNETQGNGMRTNSSAPVDGLIRLFPGALPPAAQQSKTTQGLRASSENDGITTRYTKTVATSVEAVQGRYRNAEETTDSWPANPWGGVNFLRPPKKIKAKRSRTPAPTWPSSHTTDYHTTIYWWYPVLTDNPNWKYIPDRVGVTKVCRGKSTLYNVPIVYDWLKPRIRNVSLYVHPIFWPLRKEIYDFGISEMCHTNDTREWSDYINCAIFRNMRMEYMVPKYPLHQIAYFFPMYHATTIHPRGHISTHGPGWGGK